MKQTIILTAFGTANREALNSFYTIADKIESLIPDSQALWAFTSGMIRSRLEAEGIQIPSPDRVVKECISSNTPYLVLPFQIVPGGEYENMCGAIAEIDAKSRKRVAAPLISDERDINGVLDILLRDRDSRKAVLIAAHGNGSHPSDELYRVIDRELQSRSTLFRCATLDAKPNIQEILSFYREKNVDHIEIIPLFFSAGKHLRIDIAGEKSDSWVSQFRAQEIAANVEMVPLSEKEPFIEIWIKKLTDLMSLKR